MRLLQYKILHLQRSPGFSSRRGLSVSALISFILRIDKRSNKTCRKKARFVPRRNDKGKFMENERKNAKGSRYLCAVRLRIKTQLALEIHNVICFVQLRIFCHGIHAHNYFR